MVYGYKILVLCLLKHNFMLSLCFLCLERRKYNAMAADYGLPHTVNGISANRAHIKTGT